MEHYKKKHKEIRTEIWLVEFKAPKSLIEAFDEKIKSRYSSRSEAIRELIRKFLEEEKRR